MRNRWSGQALPSLPHRRLFMGDLPRGSHVTTPVQNMLARLAEGTLPPLFEFYALRGRFVMVSSADLTGEICDEARFEKALVPGVAALREFVGDGLFTSATDSPMWRAAHDLLVPAFTKEAMRGYHDTMNDVATELVQRWDAAAASGGAVDVTADLTRMTLETIGRTAFGHSFGTFSQQREDEFVTAMVEALELAQTKAGFGLLPGGRMLGRLLTRRVRRAKEQLDTIVDSIVAERMAAIGAAALAGGHAAYDSSDHSGRHAGGQPPDLLDRMLGHGVGDPGAGAGGAGAGGTRALDPVNVRHQVITFLTAGHETTSGALAFALWFLVRHPDVAARARAEVDAVVGSAGQLPSFEQIPRLRYVRRVLDETLRLWPTAPAFARRPRVATTLGGYTMTPDDWVVVMLSVVHRDPTVWEDPERFDPDRFLPERIRARPPHAYKPFGTGERACIGRQFALHEAVLVLARVLHRYDLVGDIEAPLAVTERLTLMPRGFELSLRRRTGCIAVGTRSVDGSSSPVSGLPTPE